MSFYFNIWFIFPFLKAFGSPIIVVHDDKGERHMIFGSDRFHIIAHILGMYV